MGICHARNCWNRTGPDGTLCELHEELHEQGALDAAAEKCEEEKRENEGRERDPHSPAYIEHPPFLSEEADNPKEDGDGK